MSFEVGRLSAALTLDGVQQFHQDLDGVGRKLTETGQRGASFGRAAEAAVRTAAGATTGLVTAATAYVGILAKTGVGYNSLQQNSRAALNVLLGGAEKANAQMAKLDDFARNSPFSKSVFIEAQQQLLGFGMEAGKVVPTLDAIQQGVAAMGGSNEQISEVVNILANVQSTGKITAETLNQLGYRGLDAAQLIGDSMGKTAAQVREDITDASLDGRRAIDLLVDGMQNRFGGAADGVKEQWSGAVDRIKAAQRDLGAHIAEPFVSAQGGGMAVTWGNQVADVLRAIEKQAVPVMSILTERGMPFFAGLTQGLDSAAQSIKRWDASTLEVSLDKLANHAPGIAATAGAILALGANVGPLGQFFSVLGITINPVVAAFAGLAATSPELRSALRDLLSAGAPLLPVLGELAVILSGTLNSALPLVAGGVELLTSVLRPVIGLVSAIPTPVLAGAAAFVAMHLGLSRLQGPLAAVSSLLQQFGQRAALQATLGQTSTGIGAISAASMGAKNAVKGLGDAMRVAFLSNPIGIALTVVSVAVAAWASANASAQQKIEEHKNRVAELKDTLNETNGALTEATRAALDKSLADTKAKDLSEQIGVSYKDVQEAILGNADALERVNVAMDAHIATTTTGDKNLDTWSSTAQGARNSVRELSEIIDDNRASVEEAQRATREKTQAEREHAAAMSDSALSNQRFNDALAVARDTTQDAETRVRALKQALDELQGGQVSAEEAAKNLSRANLTLKEGLEQTDEAGKKLWQETLSGSGEISNATREGLAFADAMGQARDMSLGAMLQASDQAFANGDLAGALDLAKTAGENYNSTLRRTMEDAGLTKGQIDGLIGSYMDMPDLVATLITDNGTFSELEQQVLILLSQLDGLPDGHKIVIENPGGEETIEALRNLGYEVDELPGGKEIRITSQGKDDVFADIEEIEQTPVLDKWFNIEANDAPALGPISTVNGTDVPDKLFEVSADSTDALSKIDGVQVIQIDGKTAMVYGNNADAQRKIQDVINQGIPGKTSVIAANDASFWQRWWAIQAAAPIRKVVEIVESVVKATGSATGNMFNGGDAQAFATGGMPSGFYKAPPGQASIHKFAERELPWEAYISPKPGYRQRNINIALESLRRLAFPVIPASQVRGIPAFANGGMPGHEAPASAPSTAPPVRVERRRRRGRNAPLAETINLGVDATTNDIRTLSDVLDRLRRER